jgi:NAD(P)-dependent dehydrogenase (short-subunit alcohol dehydrogenase family)
MTLPVARDLAQYGIRVNTIAPGCSTRRCSPRCPRTRARRSGAACRSRPRSGGPRSTRSSARASIENGMLNGTVLRLDGALRMPPR